MSAASCEEVTDLLDPFADGELALSDQEAVAEHVRGCTACQLHVEELRALRGKLKRLPSYRAPAGLANRIADRLAEKREPAPRTAWSAWSMPVATHLAAALIGLGRLLDPARCRPARQPVGAARGRPCALAHGGPADRCRFWRSAPRRSLVRRQARLCAEGARPRRARLPPVGGRVDTAAEWRRSCFAAATT
jgi:anti-sigma factor RsiW